MVRRPKQADRWTDEDFQRRQRQKEANAEARRNRKNYKTKSRQDRKTQKTIDAGKTAEAKFRSRSAAAYATGATVLGSGLAAENNQDVEYQNLATQAQIDRINKDPLFDSTGLNTAT